MKLLTINVHAWLEEEQEEKLATLAQTIAARNYDVIALQEVNQLRTSHLVTRDLREDNYGLRLLERLRQIGDTRYSYYWSHSHIGYDRYEEGVALLTSLPVYEVDAFYCSQHQTVDSILSRKIVGLTVDYQGQLVDVYSCHMNLPNSPGENQLDNVRTILNRTPSKHLKILMGDFNTDAFSEHSTYQAITQLGLYDSYQLAAERDKGVTVAKAIDGWTDQAQEKRLDYIFFNQEIPVHRHQVVFNGENLPIISDHFGVEVVCNIKQTN